MTQNKNSFQKLSQNDFNQFLKRNWVNPESLELNKVSRVNAETGAKLLGRKADKPYCQAKTDENGKPVKTTFTNDFAGVCFPNFLPNEEKPRSFWIVRDNPDFVEVEGEPKKVINRVATPHNQSSFFFIPKGTFAEQLKATSPVIVTIGLLPTLAIKRLLTPEYLGKSFLTNLTENTLVIGLSNEWAWRNTKDSNGNKLEKAQPITDFDLIAWENRSVCLVFGANVRTEEMAEKARQMLKKELENRKAKVCLVDLPDNGAMSIDQLLAHPEGGDGLVLSLFDQVASTQKEATPATPAANPFIFYSVKQVLEFADPEMLISNILPCNAFAVIFGQSGVCKSFFSLHLAFCVALGRQDIFTVKSGGIIYISAEGKAGIKPRLESWINYFKSEIPDNFHYIFSPLNAMDDSQVTSFIIEIEKVCPKPQLIVIDTLARCLIGGDENSAKDVGLFINGCDKLKEATSATVLLVHHTSKNSNTERGSSALRGAADSMILVESDKIGDNSFVTVTCEKQKDLAPFEPLAYELTQVENSCVLTPSEYKKEDKKSQAVNRNKEYLQLFLTDDPQDKGISWSNVKKFLNLSDSSMNQVTNRLVKDELVRRDGEKRSVMLFITDKGKSWLANNSATK